MPSIDAGNTAITVRAGGVTAVVVFAVLGSGQAPVPTRTPTPTPAPLVPPAVALEPLLTSDNLLRVWNFNNATKVWTFFDPRPAFAAANTITGMRTGQVSWMNLVSDRVIILNGKRRTLNGGWHLVSW